MEFSVCEFYSDVFFEKGNLVHPKLRGINLVSKYGVTERSCLIPQKYSCVDDETWAKVMKVTDNDIRKMKVRDVDLCFANFIIYI